ncbi:hypothetical protein ACIBMX_47050 [Streptomyces phaeochromogenes]|uniref:hypothetical protein n=1 Tax=Streptomyces phaeochromogenes TaxID=1923 RepID=UPI00340C263A
MADNEEEPSESAEAHDEAPVEKPDDEPDETPSFRDRLRPVMEMTYWVLMIGHYGIPYVHDAWAWVQDQAFPLVGIL